MPELLPELRRLFGFAEFRPGQERVVLQWGGEG